MGLGDPGGRWGWDEAWRGLWRGAEWGQALAEYCSDPAGTQALGLGWVHGSRWGAECKGGGVMGSADGKISWCYMLDVGVTTSCERRLSGRVGPAWPGVAGWVA